MTPRLTRSLAMTAALSMLASASTHGQQNPTLADLLNQFRNTTVSWRQFEVAKRIATMGDTGVLIELEPWLDRDDRHLRGNAAFVFASLGDPRGFETIRAMLTDRSDRPLGQGIPGVAGNLATPRWWLKEQVRADRYYAVHLFGELKDPRAVGVLLPLLGDEDINYKVAWALGEIGDQRAIRPLIAALEDRDALMRVSAIQALEKLKAIEALPQLRALLNDQAFPRAGDRVSVAETARAAIAKLQKEPWSTTVPRPKDTLPRTAVRPEGERPGAHLCTSARPSAA
jgi:HEAT repeat protein